MTTRKPSGLEDHAGYWLRYVSNQVSHAFAQKIEAQGVTVAEWVLLREMLDTGAANPSLLADKLGMTRGAVSKLIERLCRKNLAERVSSEGDRRYQIIDLTAQGKRLVPVLAQLADENDRESFGHLKQEEKAKFISLLQKIVHQHGWKGRPVE